MDSPGASETADERVSAPRDDGELPELPEFGGGDEVGRYVILSPIGRGGMGVVYLAHDPELDRKVALKFLRSGRPRSRARLRARLLREAQAMARLNHPNVITVNDVGQHEGRVFLAMEYVDGRTLDRWLKEKRRYWSEIVDIFIFAGRGLVAAHDSGLVHRDFKPENVLIGKTGGVHVMDFGLVRGVGGPDDSSSSAGTSHGIDVGVTLTRVGDAIGTPAYMSPEQHLKVEADARADQFAFCVALFEALFRKRPFAGNNRAEIAKTVVEGKLRELPTDNDVPRAIRSAIIRGLSADPDDRWPTMAALLEALEHHVHRRRRRWTIAAGVVVTTGTAAALVWPPADRSTCSRAAERMDEVWGHDQRDAVERSLLGTQMPYADDAWAHVRERVDAWADRWRQVAIENCTATSERHRQQPAVMDRRAACLTRRLGELSALVSVLSDADDAVAQNAAEAVNRLRSVDNCADLDFVLSEVMPPDDPDLAVSVAGVRQRLSAAVALHWAGKYVEAAQDATILVMEAEALGYAPVVAEVTVKRGVLEILAARHEAAERDLRRGYFAATELGMAALARDAATSLVLVTGFHLSRFDEALEWSEHARAHLAQAHEPIAEARILGYQGQVARQIGEFEQAASYHERALSVLEPAGDDAALEIAEQHALLGATLEEMGRYEDARVNHERASSLREGVVGTRHPLTATSYANLATVLRYLGEYEASLDLGMKALGIYDAVLEPPHPWLAKSHDHVASTLLAMGRAEEALAHYRDAVSIHEALRGGTHPDVATALSNLGVALRRLGHADEAMASHRRALEIRESVLGPDHPKVAASLNNLGACLISVGRAEEAEPDFVRALAIRRKALRTGHPALAAPLVNLSQILMQQHRYAEATPYAREALEIKERALGPDNPGIIIPLVALAESLTEGGRGPEAVVHAERAVALAEKNPEQASILAQARIALAKSLAASDGDLDRVVALLEEGVVVLEADPASASQVEAARELLDAARRAARRARSRSGRGVGHHRTE